MFLQRKKTLIEKNIFNGFFDHHSHILPCVDDGSKSLEDSLNILNWLEELGVTKVILTPHIMEDYPQNNATNLRNEFEEFKSQYTGKIELSLGAEYMLDCKFDSHLKSGDMLTLSGNFVLVESSYFEAPLYFFETLQEIMQQGYFVVLAHPERYRFLLKEDYARLKAMGIRFQMNILSILGAYGKSVAKNAQLLLDLSYYDIVGTDIHNLRAHNKFLSTVKLPRKVTEQIEIIMKKRL